MDQYEAEGIDLEYTEQMSFEGQVCARLRGKRYRIATGAVGWVDGAVRMTFEGQVHARLRQRCRGGLTHSRARCPGLVAAWNAPNLAGTPHPRPQAAARMAAEAAMDRRDAAGGRRRKRMPGALEGLDDDDFADVRRRRCGAELFAPCLR